MGDNKVKVYVVVNKDNGARVQCTEKYLLEWLAMGFEVEEIILPDDKNNPKNSSMFTMDGGNQ